MRKTLKSKVRKLAIYSHVSLHINLEGYRDGILCPNSLLLPSKLILQDKYLHFD